MLSVICEHRLQAYAFISFCLCCQARSCVAFCTPASSSLTARSNVWRNKASLSRRTKTIPLIPPSSISLKALSVDTSTTNMVVKSLATNFDMLKALVPAPLSDYVANTPEGIIASQLTVAAVFFSYLTSPPNVLGGLLDYFRDFTGNRGVAWTTADMGKSARALGKGTYGTVSETFLTAEGLKKLGDGGRASGGRVVVKKLKDLEQTEIEAYFNRRVQTGRGTGYFATFLGGSKAEDDGRRSRLDPRMLVWEYEGSRTLRSFMTDANFPLNLEPYYYKRGQQPQDLEPLVQARGEAAGGRREAEMLRKAMMDILRAANTLHTKGLVHRDIKPANILVSEVARGQVMRLIDLGACADLRNGFNYEPEWGPYAPRYGPPEQLIMPRTTPRPPPGILALLASPFLWQTQSPDLFDSFTAGMVLLQMGVPQLRGPGGMKMVASQLKSLGNDVERWRERHGQQLDFGLLDRQNGAGWDLVCKLLTVKKKRMSVSAAMGHRFFRPDGVSALGLRAAGSQTLSKSASKTLT